MSADPIVVETTARLVGELCDAQIVNAAENGEWPTELWKGLDEAELLRAWIPESLGGPGTSLDDGFAVARAAAAAAAPVPIGETLLAGWLLADAGIEPPRGPLAVAPVHFTDTIIVDDAGRLSGVARRVPFAATAEHFAIVVQTGQGFCVALVEADAVSVDSGSSLAGEPSNTIRLEGAPTKALGEPGHVDLPERLRRMGATLRAQQMAGALEGAMELSLEYAQDREQFGRPISKFQAVQHNLAVLAGEVAAAGTSADAAASAIVRHGIDHPNAFFAVASAKIRAGEAAGAGAAIAHQVHGAMGFTLEYSLQQRTRRLWSWRDEFGPETVWAIELGRFVAAEGGDALWSRVTAV